MQVDKFKKSSQMMTVFILTLAFLALLSVLTTLAHAQDDGDEVRIPTNLVVNGNFEEGFYPVPELGFEPPDTGQVPIDWNWFKNQAFGKYTINNQEDFGLVCPGDVEQGYASLGALSLYMQSTDQQDARLGVYQTVDVVPGQDYLFSISGTIQSMQGSPEGSDFSHKVELVFDHTGGDDWRAIPNEKWTRLPWSEYELEFKVSGPEDPDIATIENYATVVRAQSNKMTIFIAAWRKWPDWRSVRYTLDCVSLTPLNEASPAGLQLVEDSKQAAAKATNGAQPASMTTETQNNTAATTPAEEPAIIPDSGGVPERDRTTTFLIIWLKKYCSNNRQQFKRFYSKRPFSIDFVHPYVLPC